MVEKLITLEDIYAKLEKIMALVQHIAAEQVYIASDACEAKVKIEEMASHLGFSTEINHEDNGDDE